MIGDEAGGDGEEDVKPLRCLIDGEIEISENPNIESSSCAADSNTSSLQVLKVNYTGVSVSVLVLLPRPLFVYH
jgi:hypothetical protein